MLAFWSSIRTLDAGQHCASVFVSILTDPDFKEPRYTPTWQKLFRILDCNRRAIRLSQLT